MLSIILLSYFSKEKLIIATEKIINLLSLNNIPFEIIIMDDGSNDNSFEIACELEEKYESVRAYQLSKNYTSHYSIFAGLSICNGACAAPLSDDEQQPYELLIDMYRLWEAGHQVIIPYRDDRKDDFLTKKMATTFYSVMNRLSDIKFPEQGVDTFFIDREIIDIINEKIHPIRTTTITEVLRLGFSPYYIPYTRSLGNNSKSRWTFKKKLRLAKDFFFSSSSFPILFITNLGLFFSFISILIIIFYSFIKIFNIQYQYFHIDSIPGWTSTIVFISFFSGLILFSLGIIAEYILRIYEEVKARPGFIIKSKNHKVLKNKN